MEPLFDKKLDSGVDDLAPPLLNQIPVFDLGRDIDDRIGVSVIHRLPVHGVRHADAWRFVERALSHNYRPKAEDVKGFVCLN